MKTVGGFLLITLCSILLMSETAHATNNRWTTGAPTFYKDVQVDHIAEQPCPTYYREISVEGLSGLRPSCQFGGERLQISRFLQDNGKNALAVKSPHGRETHLLEGICASQVRCLYSSEADILVTNFTISPTQLGVKLFRRVQERINTIFDPSTLSIRYVFNAQNPDYTFEDVNGVELSAKSIALSNNGKWLAIEIKDYGTALVDTTNFVAKRVIPTGPQYGRGSDPTVEMAVSNQGDSVAIAGSNASFLIVDVNENCKEMLKRDRLPRLPVESPACPVTNAGISSLAPSFYTVFRPRFDDSGGQLSFTFVPHNLPSRFISLISSDFHPQTKEYIALGDSFSSGEGETDDGQYKQGTNDYPDMCHVSKRSYPFLIATAMGISAERVASVACSGAKLLDILDGVGGYLGQGDRMGPPGLNLSMVERLQESERAINDLVPGRIPQSRFVDHYRPTFVTIGVGGNDAGLMTKLRSCAMPGATCEWARQENRFRTAEEIRALFDVLVSAYLDLVALSPATKFYAVGYPRVIESAGRCDAVTELLLNHDERIFMDESLRYLNDIVEAAALKAGIAYLDIEDSYEGQRLCSETPEPAMNGLRTGDDGSVISALPMLKLVGNETFHPTPTGHQLTSVAIIGRYGDLRNYQWCPEARINCPREVALGEPSEYWGSVPEDSRTLRQADFLTAVEDDPYQLRISLQEYSLRPSKEVDVELHSDSVSLGTLGVGADGGLDGTVDLPTSTVEGFHTLHILGQGYEGNQVEFYQEVIVSKVPPSDEHEIDPGDDAASTTPVDKPLRGPQSPEEQIETDVLGWRGVAVESEFTSPDVATGSSLTPTSQYLGSWTWPLGLFGCFAFIAITAWMIVRRKSWRGT